MAAGGGAACFPWLIPAGKLTSAHRVRRRTLHGGCVSGGRQEAGGGPPRPVCDPPWPVCDHFDDASSYFHCLAFKPTGQYCRHHCTLYVRYYW